MFGKLECPEPGIYPGVPNREYRSWNAPSYSLLSKVASRDYSMAHVKGMMERGSKSTAAMRAGSVFHAALLSPEELDNWRLLPEGLKVRRGKKWDELREANPEVNWMTPKEHEDTFGSVAGMVGAVLANATCAKILHGAQCEVSVVADLTFRGPMGDMTVRVKSRLDVWNERARIIADPKKALSAEPNTFGRNAWNFGYYIQSALYTDVIASVTGLDDILFYFIVVEEQPPHVVSIFDGHDTTQAGGEYMHYGRVAYQNAIVELMDCVESGIWPAYYQDAGSEIMDMVLPGWAGKD